MVLGLCGDGNSFFRSDRAGNLEAVSDSCVHRSFGFTIYIKAQFIAAYYTAYHSKIIVHCIKVISVCKVVWLVSVSRSVPCAGRESAGWDHARDRCKKHSAKRVDNHFNEQGCPKP